MCRDTVAMAAHPDTPDLPPPASIEAMVADARWLPHRYDPGQDAIHFLPVPRAEHGRATFLTDEYLKVGDPIVVRRADAVATAPSPAPIHFVFHSAFCLSTLVARAFDRPGWAMGLKEPTVFNDLVGWRRRGGQGPDMAEVLNDLLTLLARPFQAGETIVVKPSNIANAMAPAILALRPDARALFLYAPLRTFLTSVAKKGMWGRLWVRTLLLGLLDDRAIDLGFTLRDHLGQTDLQVAAVGWVAQHAQFAALAQRLGPGRLRTLDSETLLADPRRAMAGLAAHFGLALDDAGLTEILAGPAFTSHSKFGTRFDAAARADEYREAGDTHGDEIEKVAIWAEAVAENAGLSLKLDAPLID
jgi:hypothetical protein